MACLQKLWLLKSHLIGQQWRWETSSRNKLITSLPLLPKQVVQPINLEKRYTFYFSRVRDLCILVVFLSFALWSWVYMADGCPILYVLWMHQEDEGFAFFFVLLHFFNKKTSTSTTNLTCFLNNLWLSWSWLLFLLFFEYISMMQLLLFYIFMRRTGPFDRVICQCSTRSATTSECLIGLHLLYLLVVYYFIANPEIWFIFLLFYASGWQRVQCSVIAAKFYLSSWSYLIFHSWAS